ncbi:MAG: hypothetical protein Q9160_008664 [Pyrenula sp. 1 TL-2023]
MPTQSSFPELKIPDVDIWTFLFERTDREYPDDKVIYEDANSPRTYTYAEVKSTAQAFGLGIRSLWDWKRNDVLALYTPNCIDTPPIIWGTHWAGGIVSPANPGYTVAELTYQLKDSGAKAIVTQAPFLKNAQEAAKNVGIAEDRIILIGDERDSSGRFKHFTSVRNISGTQRYRRVKIANPAKDLAFLVYSSGTTGVPKGVMLSHRNVVSNTLQGDSVEGRNFSWKGGPDGKGDKSLAMLPFFHIYGLTCILHASVYQGMYTVILPKFSIEAFCSLVQKHRITFVFVVPPMVLLLAKHECVSKYDLSSIRMMNSGAAPLTKELVEANFKRTSTKVKQGYGLSETSPTTHSQLWGDWDTKIGSVGKLMPNMQAKYMTPSSETSDGEPVEKAAGEAGELYLKGPNVFLGYWKKPAETRDCLSEDGWFRTGDVGYQDKEGNFFITDRVKELIKYKGFQVPPAELEGYLVEHPFVDDVCVVGVESASLGTEVPRAYIVRKGGLDAVREGETKEVRQWLDGRVANHKKLRGGVKFVAEVPKSAAGKLLRRMLKDRAKKELAEEEQAGAKL